MIRGDWMYAYLALVWLGREYRLEPILAPQWHEEEFANKLVGLTQLVTAKAYAVTNEVFTIGIASFLAKKWNSSNKPHAHSNIAAARAEATSFISAYHVKPVKWLLVEPKQFSATANKEEIQSLAATITELMAGRSLLWSEFKALMEEHNGIGKLDLAQCMMAIQLASLQQRLVLKGAIRIEQHWHKLLYSCLRCHNQQLRKSEAICLSCGTYCLYCPNCLNMGRSRWCELTIIGIYPSPLINSYRNKGSLRNWSQLVALDSWGLSNAQSAATKQTLDYVSLQLATLTSQIPTYLIWAVTGAGKTEMIFPIVDYVTKLGGRVLIASPRRDVVIELDPRIRKAFPASTVVTLYGGSTERWAYGEIVLSTTHQLMRFNRAFELVIIDEVDAFPYHGDPLLYKVADDSCAFGGVKILLSATPPRKLQRLARIGKLAHTRVPVRYHRHPLPVPHYIKSLPVKQLLEKRTIPSTLQQSIAESLQRGAQLFFFVQRIAYTEPFKGLLQQWFPGVPIAATSSKDSERAQKVSDFRACSIRILITTTILERGVTIPKSDVYIFDADGKLFDESSLVQMGGRAGRSADDPKGKVYFIAAEINSAQRLAIRQIKMMNRIAAKKGYLLESYGTRRLNRRSLP